MMNTKYFVCDIRGSIHCETRQVNIDRKQAVRENKQILDQTTSNFISNTVLLALGFFNSFKNPQNTFLEQKRIWPTTTVMTASFLSHIVNYVYSLKRKQAIVSNLKCN